MVMKRYPKGAEGEFFFQKRIPEPHPEWVETCEILHASGNTIRFPLIQASVYSARPKPRPTAGGEVAIDFVRCCWRGGACN